MTTLLKLDPDDVPDDGDVPTFDDSTKTWRPSAPSGGGGVTNHGELDGLGDDDHPQYALADGSRGSFASTAQGSLADSAVQPGDLGDSAGLDVGTTAGTVAAGDDPRFGAISSDPFPYRALVMGPGAIPGYYHAPMASAVTGAAVIDNRLMGQSIWLPAGTIDRVGIRVVTAGGSGSVVRLGIYADNNGLPGDLLIDAGTVDATETGYLEITTSVAIEDGAYWLMAAVQGSATPAPIIGLSTTAGVRQATSATAGGVYAFTNAAGLSLNLTTVAGALPSPWPVGASVTAQAAPPRMFVRVS